MATIHKLTKDGSTIFPATITDAIVHPNTGKTLTSMIKEYNVSELFPTEGVDGGNKYNLALAVQVLGTHLTAAEKTGGIKLLFTSSTSPYPTEEYFLGKSTWSGNTADWDQRFEVGDVIANPSGSWNPGTAEQYIDQQTAILTTNLASETIARQGVDSNLQTQINSEVSNRTAADTTQNNRLSSLESAYRGLTESDVIVGPRPSTGQQTNVIYREPDQGHTPPQFYCDYMWYNNDWVLMARYDNGIDDNPLPSSNNLVKSSGVFNSMGAFDVSAYNSSATYQNLTAALNAVPNNMRAGGMSVKFIQEITPAQYTVVRTPDLTTQPTGTALSEDPNIVSGTYTAAELNNLNTASALPSTLNSSKTYYLEVSTGNYTSWVVTYVQSSDNKYVQARCMAQNFTTDVTQWQGVDDVPNVDSQNIPESKSVFNNLIGVRTLERNDDVIKLEKCIKAIINSTDGVLKSSPNHTSIAYNIEGLDKIYLYSDSSCVAKYYAFYSSLEYESESIDGKHDYVNGTSVISIPSGAKYVVFLVVFKRDGNPTGTVEDIILRKTAESVSDVENKIFTDAFGILKCKEIRFGSIAYDTGNYSPTLNLKCAVYDISSIEDFTIYSENIDSSLFNTPYFSFFQNITDTECLDGKHDFIRNGYLHVQKPVNANYLIMIITRRGNGDLSNFAVIKGFSTYNLLNSILKGINHSFSEILLRPYPNSVLHYDNKYTSTTSIDSNTSDWIDTQEGDEFLYIGWGSGGDKIPIEITTSSYSVSWIFADDNLNIISAWRVKSINKATVVTIPNGVTKVKFNSMSRFDSHSERISFSVQKVNNIKKKWGTKKWCCVGDSLTQSVNRAPKRYMDYISEKTGISIYNMGVSGSGYKELENENNAIYQRISGVPNDSDVITIFGSGNDMHKEDGQWKFEIGEITDTGTTTLCGCINTTLDYLQQNYPLIPLGIVTPTPWKSWDLYPEISGNRMELYSEAIIAICKRRGISCLDLYHCSQLHPESAAFRNLAYTRDGTYTSSTSETSGAIQVSQHNLDAVRTHGLPNAEIGDWVLPSLSGVHPDEYGHKLMSARFEAFLESLILD